ncbi:hypothetical protein E2C01_052010 [Portunus trituberculatus]|uniref:Uncharacterized protein n=1 Tax=Portunus trituberculatus TaxID=210409 RepID=A0A5B7GLX6_PORTR|nr:hypothetical protein [Portunus trituberculatus]
MGRAPQGVVEQITRFYKRNGGAGLVGVPGSASAGLGRSDEFISYEIVTGTERSGPAGFRSGGSRCGCGWWALDGVTTV